MFGKQTKKKAIEKEIPKVEESVDLEIEDIKQEQEKVIEEEEPKEEIKFNATPEKIASAQEKIKEIEKNLEEAKAKLSEEEELKDFMTVNSVEIVGEGIYKYTLIATKPLWAVGTIIKL